MKKLILIGFLVSSITSFGQASIWRNKNYCTNEVDSLSRMIEEDSKTINTRINFARLYEKGNIISYSSDSNKKLEKIEVYKKSDCTLRVQYLFKNSLIFKMGKFRFEEEWREFNFYYLDNGVVFKKITNSNLSFGMEESEFLKQGYFYLNKFKSK